MGSTTPLALLAAVLVLAFDAPARAQEAETPAPAAPPARAAPTFESLHIEPSEITGDRKLESEPAFASPQAAKLLDGSALGDAAAALQRRDHQTISGPSGRGSILFLEFAPKIPDGLLVTLRRHFWAEEGRPTRLRPELVARAGNVVVVLSFPLTSPIRSWTCDRMRRRFGLRLPTESEEARPLLAPVLKQYEAGNAESGLQLLRSVQARLAHLSHAAWLEGELCNMKEDWAGGARAFARALELDAASDPLPGDEMAHACIDGRTLACYGLKKFEDAAASFREAAHLAAEIGMTRAQGISLYNCACSLALSGRGDEAIAALKESISAEPQMKAEARRDKDFDSIRARPEFAALLQ